ncbi:helix-turn-helix domain-containing protein [Candidatus Woesearchaeota archaeon]|nr:helix-turn-helix domain-containing protein [Candidatus Woesearchaeota archaeon]
MEKRDQYYIIKEEKGKLLFTPSADVSKSAISSLDNPVRITILQLLAKKALYTAEIAAELKVHEQNIYYHLKQMIKEGLLEVAEKKEIRGTIAKKYKTKALNFSLILSQKWQDLSQLVSNPIFEEHSLLYPFVEKGVLSSLFVIGSPDPHGEFKARCRDGHFALDLALFFGRYCTFVQNTVKLDVEMKNSELLKENLIIIGGPATNLIAAEMNTYSPIKFILKKPWEIATEKNRYSDEAIGLITKFKNPFNNEKYVLLAAGISSIGTRSTIIALTKYSELFKKMKNVESFGTVVQGFDLDGDGIIDDVEIIE